MKLVESGVKSSSRQIDVMVPSRSPSSLDEGGRQCKLCIT